MTHKEKLAAYLKDAIVFYGEEPEGRRAASGAGAYFYLDRDTGNKCLVGRLCDRQTLDAFNHVEGTVGEALDKVSALQESGELPEFVPKTVDGVPFENDEDFWGSLQSMHDNSGSWTKMPRGDILRKYDTAAKEYLTTEGLAHALEACRYAGVEPKDAIPGWRDKDQKVFDSLGVGCMVPHRKLKAAYERVESQDAVTA